MNNINNELNGISTQLTIINAMVNDKLVSTAQTVADSIKETLNERNGSKLDLYVSPNAERARGCIEGVISMAVYTGTGSESALDIACEARRVSWHIRYSYNIQKELDNLQRMINNYNN